MLRPHSNEHIKLKHTLVNTRTMTSLMDRELALATGDIKRETINWVPMWVDWGHSFRLERTKATAIRAISDAGELLWYVRHDTKKHGYHSVESDPFRAIAEAKRAWDHRRIVRNQWSDVVATSKDLLSGQRKLTITIQDAEESALCSIGIKWFLKRMGLARIKSLSGRSAAILMKIEPQMGFVIHQAALRDSKVRNLTMLPETIH